MERFRWSTASPSLTPHLRDNENVPLASMKTPPAQLRAQIEDYMKQEVLPYAPDAWVDHAKTKVGLRSLSFATSTSTSHPVASQK